MKIFKVVICLCNRIALGSRIKAIRQKRGENQEQFGKHFTPPSNKGTVSRWESGISKPSAQRLREIAELGGVTVNFLLNGDATTVEETQKLLNKITNHPESTSIEEKKQLNSIQLELSQMLKLHDLNEKTKDSNIHNEQLNDFRAEMSVFFDGKLTYTQVEFLTLVVKLFNNLNLQDDSSSIQKFKDIIFHVNQIAEGNEPYDKKKDLAEIGDFLTKLSMSS